MNEPVTIYPDKMFVKIYKADKGQTEEQFTEFIRNRFSRYELVEYSKGAYLFKRKQVREVIQDEIIP